MQIGNLVTFCNFSSCNHNKIYNVIHLKVPPILDWDCTPASDCYQRQKCQITVALCNEEITFFVGRKQ